MNTPTLKQLCTKLKRKIYVGHWLRCGKWSQFMANCQQHPCLSIEIPKQIVDWPNNNVDIDQS